MSDPKRLVDDPQTSTLVRETLALGQRATLPEYDAAKGLERLLTATAPIAAAGIGGWTLARALKLLVLKWWPLAVVGTAAVGSATYVVYEEHAIAPAPTATTLAPRPAKVSETSPPASSSATEAPAEVPPEVVAAPSAAAPIAPVRSSAHTKQTVDERVAREVRLLGRARAALANDPAEALARTQEGEREFPQGVLSEEREAIAVLALARLGRTREAEARGSAFLTRYPNGPFSARVRLAIAPANKGPAR